MSPDRVLYVAAYEDDLGLPRAYGQSSDQAEAEALADIEADEYQARRPDIVWDRRVTYEFLASDIWVEIESRQIHHIEEDRS